MLAWAAAEQGVEPEEEFVDFVVEGEVIRGGGCAVHLELDPDGAVGDRSCRQIRHDRRSRRDVDTLWHIVWKVEGFRSQSVVCPISKGSFDICYIIEMRSWENHG